MPTSNSPPSLNLKWIIGGAVLILILLLARQIEQPSKSDKRGIETPVDAFFESKVANEPGPIIVKFGAEWCGPCRALDSALAEYSKTKDSLKVVFVDTDRQPELAAHYGVRGIPHSFLFKNGKVIDDRVGSMSLSSIKKWVNGQTEL